MRSEIETWPIINGFSRYVISHEGLVYNRARIRPVLPSMTSGRLKIGLTDDEDFRRTVSLARLVAAHFLPFPHDGDDQYYDVRPIDGNHANVHAGNLEWVARWKLHADPNNYRVDI